jgi:hypothetical protein
MQGMVFGGVSFRFEGCESVQAINIRMHRSGMKVRCQSDIALLFSDVHCILQRTNSCQLRNIYTYPPFVEDTYEQAKLMLPIFKWVGRTLSVTRGLTHTTIVRFQRSCRTISSAVILQINAQNIKVGRTICAPDSKWNLMGKIST